MRHRKARVLLCPLRLLKYYAQHFHEPGPPQTAHTNLGSLTVLFSKHSGLQVLQKGAGEWSL